MGFEGSDAKEDGRGRVPDQDLGGIGGWYSIGWRKLREAGQERSLTPDILLELAVLDCLGSDNRRRKTR
jgi:hypothetical protein